jgi:iron complex outermembrane receptor protein
VDLDFQHHFGLGPRNDVLWGAGYRLITDEVTGAFAAGFDPPSRTVHLVTGFVQDEIVLLQNRVALNLGSKFEHNSFTGFELQPTARVLWTPSLNSSAWAAVSRAVRTPSRVDSDIQVVAQVFDAPPVTLVEAHGSDALEAEELIAYEAGYRVVPNERLSIDVSAYYHDYHRVRSVAPEDPITQDEVVTLPFVVRNDAKARSYGGTASATVRLGPRWRMRANYTYLNMEAALEDDAPAGSVADVNPGLNPEHQLGLWSSTDLPAGLELDVMGRYVSELDGPVPAVDGYLQADARLGLALSRHLQIALIGRDLLSRRRVEFPQPGSSVGRRAIERQVRARLLWRF